MYNTDGMLELHADDGHGTGKPEVIRRCFSLLEEHIELKWVDGLVGNATYDFLTSMRAFKDDRFARYPIGECARAARHTEAQGVELAEARQGGFSR